MTVLEWSVVVLVALAAFIFVLYLGQAKPKARLLMALRVRKGKKGKLRLVTVPVGASIDVQDVPVTVESSDPATVEAVLVDGAILWRTPQGGTPGLVTVTARADADQDSGEVRLLPATFEFDVVESATEPESIGLELDGPVEDDV